MVSSVSLCGIDKCTQCYSCSEVCPQKCISFIEEKDGFSIPKIDYDKCIGCRLCVRSCHVLTPKSNKVSPRKVYAAWNLNSILRSSSSSGGVFSVLANYALNHQGVVYGATIQGHKVHHIRVDSIQNVSLLRGSKYVQSNISGIYPQVEYDLKQGLIVLFSGTPCQVAGLYSFLKKSYESLITIDLVCHGVPSQGAFDIYCKRIGLTGPLSSEISFRYLKGWGLQLSKYRTTPDKCKIISPRLSYYLRAFTKGLMFSEACFNCLYATPERGADFTLADFWGIGAIEPFSHSKDRGVSLLLVNSEKAEQVLRFCDSIYFEERPQEEAFQGNSNLNHVSERPAGHDTYYNDSLRLPLHSLLRKYNIQPSFKDYLRPIKRWFISRLNP